jgi:hypothetical protein
MLTFLAVGFDINRLTNELLVGIRSRSGSLASKQHSNIPILWYSLPLILMYCLLMVA